MAHTLSACACVPGCLYEIVTGLSAEGCILVLDALVSRTRGSSLKSSQAFLTPPAHVWMAACTLPPVAPMKQRLIIPHDLLSSASTVACGHWI